MNIVADLIIDFGNSETRAYLKKPNSNNFIKLNLSNRFYPLVAGQVIPANYKCNKTFVFSIGDGEYKGNYSNGEFVIKEYETSAIKPTALDKKYSKNSALTFALVCLHAMRILRPMYSDVDLSVEWNVTCLMPPASVDDGSKELLLTELRKVSIVNDLYNEFNRPVSVPTKINSFEVFPEGFAAYVACMYNRSLEIRRGYEKFAEGIVLVLDIGAGTTDIMVIDNSEVIDNTKDTFDIGGNNVRAKLKKQIKNNYGHSKINDSELELAMSTGEISDGNSTINIVKEIMDCKRGLAQEIVEETQSYLEGISYNLRRINGLLVVGGGALGGDIKEIEPISRFVVEYIKQYAPNVLALDIPNDPDVKLTERDLNIEGALILSLLE